MKTVAFLLLAFLGVLLFYQGTFSLAPTDIQAATVWNLCLILAPVFALYFQWKIARERQVSTTIFLTVWAVINSALVLGSRAGAWTSKDWSVLVHTGNLPELPGKTILGGLVLAIVVFAALRRWWKISFSVADALIIGLPLAGVAARIGCLYAGCCFGIATGGDHGICYGPGSPAYIHQIQAGLLPSDAAASLPVYPIQLILVFGNLLIFGVLWHFRKAITRPGALSFLGLSLLTLQRFGIEFFREIVTNRGQFSLLWGGMKMAQWVCLLLALMAILGFLWVQFGKSQQAVPRRSVSLKQQALVIGGIALGILLMRSLLTLDETMIILVSCLPGIVVLSHRLKRAYKAGEKVLSPALMLSATALTLFLSPLDTIPASITPMDEPINRQWIEIGTGGGIGNYQKISRDCGGSVVSRETIQYQSGGLDVSSNWQRGDVFIQSGIRGAFGKAKPSDSYLYDQDYRYSSFGLYGKISYDAIGFSLGLFNRQQIFEDGIKKNSFLPSMNLRLGTVKKYSCDLRIYDEPAFSLSNEPVFSMGLFNWGFKDPSGSTFLRLGFAATSLPEFAFTTAFGFPLSDSGFSATVAGYIGNANMIQLGLRYRLKDVKR